MRAIDSTPRQHARTRVVLTQKSTHDLCVLHESGRRHVCSRGIPRLSAPQCIAPLAAMVTLVAVGVFLISMGPSAAISILILRPRAHLLVLAILGAFAWSLAMMLSGALWLAIPPLKTTFAWVLFVTVTMQELMRYVLFTVFRFMARTGDGVQAFLRPGAKNTLLTGMSVGVGFGMLSVLVNFYSVVIDNFSVDTAIYNDVCGINFFVAGGIFALAYSLLHILLGIIVWPAYSEDPGWDNMALGYFLHLGIAEMSLLNQRNGGCRWNLGVVWGLILIVVAITFVQSKKRIRKESA